MKTTTMEGARGGGGDTYSIADTGTPKPLNLVSFFMFFCSLRAPIPALGVVGALPAEFTDAKPASAAVLRGCSHVVKATKRVCKSSDTPAGALVPAHRWSWVRRRPCLGLYMDGAGPEIWGFSSSLSAIWQGF